MQTLIERNNYISFDGFEMINNKVVLSNLRGNGLFVVDSHDFHIERLEKFINMPDEIQRYHSGVCKWNSNVYFYPNIGYGIHKYNVVTNEQTYIETDHSECGSAFIQDDCMVLLPQRKASGIWKLDLKTNKLWKEEWWELGNDEIGTNFLNSGQIDENRIWMSAANTPYLFITDLSARNTDSYMVGNKDTRIFGTAYDGRDYWFTLFHDEHIVRLRIGERTSKYYNANREKNNNEKYLVPYKKIIVYEDKVIVVPADCSGIYLLDTINDRLERLAALPKNIKIADRDWNVGYRVFGRKLVMCFGLTNLVAVMDLDLMEIDYYDTTIRNNRQFDCYVQNLCDEKIKEILNMKLIAEGMNSDLANLKDFIGLVNMERYSEGSMSECGKIGDCIYKNVFFYSC